MTTARLVAVGVDAVHPRRLAHFWAVALRRDIEDGDGDEIRVVPTDGAGLPVVFVPAGGPKTGRNRNHFDLTTTSLDDQRQTVARLVELGGRHVDVGQSADEPHVVLADPEGNELCVIEPGNSFLAGCGRLGAINCDGRRVTGRFWSDVLGWPLVWDQDEETAIRAPDGGGPMITWSGPPLLPKVGRNRIRLHVAPPGEGGQRGLVERLVELGATPADAAPGPGLVMADPDGNEFCVVR